MTIMDRSATKRWWGFVAPKEVSHYIKTINSNGWKAVTWKEIFIERTKKQNEKIIRKRLHEKTLPCYLWVFNNEQHFTYGGWWIYLVIKNKDFAINFRNSQLENKILPQAMKLFPCGVVPLNENFEKWCESFCKNFPKKSKKRKNEGAKICYVQLNKYGEPEKLIAK